MVGVEGAGDVAQMEDLRVPLAEGRFKRSGTAAGAGAGLDAVICVKQRIGFVRFTAGLGILCRAERERTAVPDD